ncbi:hypothetical protein [Alteriqipengyuania lutimaris]|uniref:Uncharacterized protein n=1 Tax=Alteriqipengyuania lutimaris TaxID=1538146 RepID=A0A395LL54_9SPHN|nr:hypothetical protein [Alteriqipengyuania lutimaris]MBB3033925.1 putative flap endonuclease-1-like 5' DNA nuclease [Alteriqipengyuania lutimaris]RDS77117.1 hypothetical protein DL238_05475 [Alteriqipengyuania lutimaris]
MIELIEANWLLILLAVLVGFVVAWFLLSGSRKTRVTREDSPEETGTKRNQALIDAPPAAAKDPAPPAASGRPAAATPAPAPAPEAETIPPPPPASTAATPAPTPAPAPAPVPTPRAEPAATATGGAGAAVGGVVAEEREAAQTPPAASDTGAADDLTRLKGVGPKLATQLNALGVTSFGQIASWSEADIDRIDDQLGRFKGRIRRDNWIEQARLLESGDTAAYESRFGKL